MARLELDQAALRTFTGSRQKVESTISCLLNLALAAEGYLAFGNFDEVFFQVVIDEHILEALVLLAIEAP